MARLSKEHYRTMGTMPTPKSTRTSGRIRNIFKPQLVTKTNSTKLPASSAPTIDESASNSPSNRRLSQALMVGFPDSNAEDSESSRHIVADETDVSLTELSGTQWRRPVLSGSGDALSMKAIVESNSTLSSSKPSQDHSRPKQNVQSSRKALASNVFENRDALSAGVREYVDSKIAEALHKHSYVCPNCNSLEITAKVELGSWSDTSTSSFPNLVPVRAKVLQCPKRVGPIILAHSSNTYDLQREITGLYIIAVLFAAFIGPKTLFMTVWKLATALFAYCIVGKFFEWNIQAEDDLLLVPVLFIACYARDALRYMADWLSPLKFRLGA